MFENLYSYILDGIFEQKSRQQGKQFSKHNQIQHLQSLQPYVRDLRKSYNNSAIKVDYSDPNTQSAYLIAYVPQYSELTLAGLEHIQDHVQDVCGSRSEIFVCLFGAGPCPELIAIAEFCTKYLSNVSKVHSYIFDINVDAWKFSTDITRNIVSQHWKQISLQFDAVKFDLCDRSSLSSNKARILKQADLVIFQNCINELDNHGSVLGLVQSLLSYLKPSALCLIIDQAEYESVGRTITSMKQGLDEHCFAVRNYLEKRSLRSKLSDPYENIPKIIRENLLTKSDGLKPRININYTLLSISRIPERVRVLEPVIKKKIGANLQSSEANIATIEQLLKLRASFDENRERVNSEMEKFHELIASQSQKNNELNELNTLLIQRLEVSEKANKEMEKRLNHFSFEISKLNRRFVQLIICFCIGFSIALLVAIFI